MKRFLLLLLLTTSCVDPRVPPYPPPTVPTAPSPSPPPPSPPPAPALLSVTLSIGPQSPLEGASAAFSAFVSPAPVAATYGWTFGDGAAQGTTTNVVRHTYARAGQYDASVNVTDDQQRTALHGVRVTVRAAPGPPPPPAPPPAPPPSTLSATLACANAPAFTQNCVASATYNGVGLPSSAVSSVTWDWGDGSALLTLPSPVASHTYPFANTFTIFATVTATTSAGVQTTTTTKTIAVN